MSSDQFYSSGSMMHGVQSVVGRYGRLLVPARADIIADALRNYGEWAEVEIDILSAFIREGDTVLDVGACLGTHSIAFAKKVGAAGSVVSFEPAPFNFSLLCSNVEENAPGNVVAHNVAVSSRPDVAKILVPGGNIGGAQLLAEDASGGIEVRVVTLDSLSLARVDFMKIDTEGSYLAVLQGASHILETSHPVVFAEANSVQSAISVFEYMKTRGYSAYGVNSPAFNPDNFFHNAGDIFHGGSECGLLLIHAAREAELSPSVERLNLLPIKDADDIVGLLMSQRQYRLSVLPELTQIDHQAEELHAARTENERLHQERDAAVAVAEVRNQDIERHRLQVAELERAGETLKHALAEEHEARLSENERHLRHAMEIELANAELKRALTDQRAWGKAREESHQSEIDGYLRRIRQIEEDRDALTRQLTDERARARTSKETSRRRVTALEAETAQLERVLARERAGAAQLVQASERAAGAFDTVLDLHRASIKLSRRANTFPAVLYFGIRAKYRRLIRQLLRSGSFVSETVVPDLAGLRQAVNLCARTVEGAGSHGGGDLATQRDEVYELCATRFDSAFYLAAYPDVAAAGIDPLRHYLDNGAREGRDPAPWFETKVYLGNSPDIAKLNINPFWHFIAYGEGEGRLARHPDGAKTRQLALLESLKTQPEPVPPSVKGLTASAIAGAIRGALDPEHPSLVLSVAHDDWLSVVGGTQLGLQHEARESRKAGITHLSFFPIQPLSTLAPLSAGPAEASISLVLDSKPVGPASYEALAEALRELAGSGVRMRNRIHHLIGVSPEKLVDVIRATGEERSTYYLHDYFGICEQYNLLRNTVTYCGGPKPTSASCSICHYGSTRPLHLARLQALFEAIEITVVSPSQVAADIWREASALPVAGIIVRPHGRLAIEERTTPLVASNHATIRIAYAGQTTLHKGCDVFQKLLDAHHDEDDVEFFYFGTATPYGALTRQRVAVSADHRNAMVEAIQAKDIDFVVHFAPWPENFSFSAFEALAAGSFVLTGEQSGNVAAMVRETGRDKVFPSAAALVDWIGTTDCRELLAKRRMQHRAEEIHPLYSDLAVPGMFETTRPESAEVAAR